MTPFDLKNYLSRRRTRIEEAMKDLMARRGIFDQHRLGAAMRYSLMAGGKRLRPILCLAACEAGGGDPEDAVPAACALELVHTYSLVHDDLPAMDDDALRRGLPTCHTAFDEATAILAGDGLLTLAFEILADEGIGPARFGPSERISTIHRIASAAGAGGMVEGQMRDIAAEGTVLSLEALTELHRLKTGALIEAAVWCGGRIAGAEGSLLTKLSRYGQSAGLAFQVTDDILNVSGDPEKLGKSVGTDADRKKSTYPSLLGLTSSQKWARELVAEAIAAVSDLDHRAEPLRAIARYVVERQR